MPRLPHSRGACAARGCRGRAAEGSGGAAAPGHALPWWYVFRHPPHHTHHTPDNASRAACLEEVAQCTLPGSSHVAGGCGPPALHWRREQRGWRSFACALHCPPAQSAPRRYVCRGAAVLRRALPPTRVHRASPQPPPWPVHALALAHPCPRPPSSHPRSHLHRPNGLRGRQRAGLSVLLPHGRAGRARGLCHVLPRRHWAPAPQAAHLERRWVVQRPAALAPRVAVPWRLMPHPRASTPPTHRARQVRLRCRSQRGRRRLYRRAPRPLGDVAGPGHAAHLCNRCADLQTYRCLPLHHCAPCRCSSPHHRAPRSVQPRPAARPLQRRHVLLQISLRPDALAALLCNMPRGGCRPLCQHLCRASTCPQK